MIIAEVGLNHLGDETLAMKYVEKLANMKVDGITFQIPSETFFKEPKNKYLKLNPDCIIEALRYTKSMGVKFGLAIGDVKVIEEFKNHEVDFYKVLSSFISSDVQINKLVNKTKKKIFFSTGFSDYQEISELLQKVKNIKQRIELVHINLGGNVENEWLSRISLLKSKYGVPVGYSAHCFNKNAIYLSLTYKPDSLFFYVKIDNKRAYPDNDHAFTISKVPFLLKNIKDLKKTIGSRVI